MPRLPPSPATLSAVLAVVLPVMKHCGAAVLCCGLASAAAVIHAAPLPGTAQAFSVLGASTVANPGASMVCGRVLAL